jgi:hypothetical protein
LDQVKIKLFETGKKKKLFETGEHRIHPVKALGAGPPRTSVGNLSVQGVAVYDSFFF